MAKMPVKDFAGIASNPDPASSGSRRSRNVRFGPRGSWVQTRPGTAWLTPDLDVAGQEITNGRDILWQLRDNRLASPVLFATTAVQGGDRGFASVVHPSRILEQKFQTVGGGLPGGLPTGPNDPPGGDEYEIIDGFIPIWPPGDPDNPVGGDGRLPEEDGGFPLPVSPAPAIAWDPLVDIEVTALGGSGSMPAGTTWVTSDTTEYTGDTLARTGVTRSLTQTYSGLSGLSAYIDGSAITVRNISTAYRLRITADLSANPNQSSKANTGVWRGTRSNSNTWQKGGWGTTTIAKKTTGSGPTSIYQVAAMGTKNCSGGSSPRLDIWSSGYTAVGVLTFLFEHLDDADAVVATYNWAVKAKFRVESGRLGNNPCSTTGGGGSR